MQCLPLPDSASGEQKSQTAILHTQHFHPVVLQTQGSRAKKEGSLSLGISNWGISDVWDLSESSRNSFFLGLEGFFAAPGAVFSLLLDPLGPIGLYFFQNFQKFDNFKKC